MSEKNENLRSNLANFIKKAKELMNQVASNYELRLTSHQSMLYS